MARRENGRHNSKARLDSRGRVSIPRSVRKHLGVEKGDTVVILKDFTGEDGKRCVTLHPFDNWKKIERNLRKKLNLGDEDTKEIIRELMGDLEYVEIDELGRILLPGNLISSAGLKNEVLFVKMPGFVEIWNPEIREQKKKEARAKISPEKIKEILNFGGDYEE